MLENLFSLKDKIAIITGASRGIGRAISRAFGEAGADLVVSSRNKRPPELEKVAEEVRSLGRKTLAIPAHVGKREDVENLVRKALQEFGRIDILVNNAGANPILSTMVDLEEEAFEKVLEVNLKGAFLMSQAVAREMIKQGGGRIINMSSISGLRARADRTGAYCISKAALNMMTQVMARELAPHNILVNAIAPGSIKTDFSRVNWTDPERKAQRIREIELRRFGEPEEVVGIALFLASEASSFVTGEIIRVDGGQTI
ncbi:MAG: SDR family oxidoreductase [Thermodesulfobacteriota bacterium]|jgi:NAD(P)-dependent dehydrogenase (short-subunit alcohol dehydrogenase family)